MSILTRHLAALMLGVAFAVTQQAAAQSSNPVKLGLIDPVKTLVGEQNIQGAQLAVAMINEDGGILGGRRLELVTYDTNFQPPEGVAAVQRLLTLDEVKIVIGEISSSVALAVIPVVENQDAIFIASVPKHPDVTKSGYDKVFRLNSTTALDAQSFDKYLTQTVKPQKVALLAENSDFGQVTINHMKELFGDKLVYSDAFGMQQSDFAAMSTNAVSSGADLICIVGSNMEQYGNILRELSDIGYKGKRCLMPGVLNAKGVDIAGASAEGAFSADIYLPSMNNAFNKRFVAAFQKKFGHEPEKIEVLGFEAVWIAAEAMDKAGTADDTDKIAEAIRSNNWETPRGEVSFDKDGQASSGQLIPLVVKSGKIVVNE